MGIKVFSSAHGNPYKSLGENEECQALIRFVRSVNKAFIEKLFVKFV
jgi:hypothetical protein